MKMIDDVIIIGIDSGYGNIKTANCCFPASLSAYDREPVFKMYFPRALRRWQTGFLTFGA